MKIVSKWWATNKTVAEELQEALTGYVSQELGKVQSTEFSTEQDPEYTDVEVGDGPLWLHCTVTIKTGREHSNGEGHDAFRAVKLFRGLFEGEFIDPELFMQVSICGMQIEDANVDYFRGMPILEARLSNLENMAVEGHNKADSALDTVGEMSLVIQQLTAQVETLTEHVNQLRAVPFNTVDYQQLACGTYAMAKRLGMEDLIVEPQYVNIH